ncbi:peptidylprolyl isomerase [Flammeovirga kamogawensis]|uniref:Periplasmic chaperone PpiD n=1 Tax=Flammeovirga kamogawensis TaxID=373891 RepID=A0ABX8GSL0_9BACT|nr:SurA N-terminal domain-containing protein [Flammeovirga kamogawensis]MBB6461331.1 peptidyl-prolyl cis-trans isomerase D [Flammeovirga kamogawensis]QWG06237.1 SurA N-terminal domain-containing protein [Flammeovirga kamogawensis]TRX68068.1 hypothetical protein EO216_07950 [Flammeovirga kamogawensis]
MAIITKIREKSGVAVGFIALGLILFMVGGDLFSPNSTLLGNNKNIVGEIGGQEIELRQFSELVDQIKSNYPTPPNEQQMQGVRQMAWNELIYREAYGQQIEELGITITPEELNDMISGNNISPEFGQYFRDSTGQVSRENIKMYLASLKQQGPTSPQYQQFLGFEQQIKTSRSRIKYENLISRTYFASDLEGKKEYEKQNDKVEIAYVNVPFYSMPDSVVNVTESDAKAYYNANQEEFKRDANRGIEFVTFKVQASEGDKKNLEDEMKDLSISFARTSNDTAFVESHTDGNANFMSVNMTGLPSVLDADQLETGKVYGPFFAAGSYRDYKVLGESTDSVYSAKASHILFKNDKDDAAAKKEAYATLRKIQNGENFEELAKKVGDAAPTTKSRGGDLQWFSEGRMVPAFDKAVFSARKTGLINRVVKTEFGYHIIKVTAVKTKKMFDLAVVEKKLTPSDATVNEAYRKASVFAASVKGGRKDFEKIAEDQKIFIEQALTIAPTATFINSLRGNSVRQVIRWAYNDADVNDVSEVFDLDDRFIVATLMSAREEGIADFAEVKNEAKVQATKGKKAEAIAAKLNKLSGKSIEDIRKGYGNGAKSDIASDLSLNDVSIQGVGLAPKAIGTAFGLKQGEVSKPIIDENSVLVVKVRKADKALETADYSIYQRQVEGRYVRSANYNILEAVKTLSDVKDNRYKFF